MSIENYCKHCGYTYSRRSYQPIACCHLRLVGGFPIAPSVDPYVSSEDEEIDELLIAKCKLLGCRRIP